MRGDTMVATSRAGLVVVERDGAIIAFAAAQPSSLRACYARNAEFSVYVQRDMRGQGVGPAAMGALADILREMKFNKLVSHIFAENEASLRMLRAIGFRESGLHPVQLLVVEPPHIELARATLNAFEKQAARRWNEWLHVLRKKRAHT